ncbi:protein kinase domain-containing protein [Calothrix sp. UHCC 0171]|uniref:protein kinase domain-containing protein n=1 Tax=Calothrix sp. UHCC 0171 TaxID=3110245 RepID=UPI002B20446B|nr:protein kinase [Calothrix sp. UHCC 0171]MEA5570428.1 protein kinase [Calothrix sp. UHCC 0171]
MQSECDRHPLCPSRPRQSGQKWTQKQAIAFLQDVLKILEFVHKENVIHRDIKPTNLIRRHLDQKIVLIDFGAVKAITNVMENS